MEVLADIPESRHDVRDYLHTLCILTLASFRLVEIAALVGFDAPALWRQLSDCS